MKSSLNTFFINHRIYTFISGCVPLASLYMYLKSRLNPLLNKCFLISDLLPSILMKSVSANTVQVFRISHKGPSEILFESILRQTLYLRRLSSIWILSEFVLRQTLYLRRQSSRNPIWISSEPNTVLESLIGSIWNSFRVHS